MGTITSLECDICCDEKQLEQTMDYTYERRSVFFHDIVELDIISDEDLEFSI